METVLNIQRSLQEYTLGKFLNSQWYSSHNIHEKLLEKIKEYTENRRGKFHIKWKKVMLGTEQTTVKKKLHKVENRTEIINDKINFTLSP
jgi:hypothetical protein